METCEYCGTKVRDKDALMDHILLKHTKQDSTSIEITPEVCKEMGLTPTEVGVVKNSIATGASDEELLYFLNAAKVYGLNPIKKEIYYTKLGGKVTLMVSRDGYLKLAQNNPAYRGLHSAAVHEKDTFTINTTTNADGKMIQAIGHEIPGFGNRGKILGAWCKIDMEGQAPTVGTVKWEDFNKNTPIWKQYGGAMIEKVAQAIALKRVSGASGLVSTAEMIDTKYSKEIQAIDLEDGQVIETEAKIVE